MAKKHKTAPKHHREHRPHTHTYYHLIIITLSLVAAFTIYSLFRSSSNANDSRLNYQNQIAKKQCDITGSPAINVTQQVKNDADSGQAGNYWAFDTFSRHIQVWKQTDGSYCALVDYEGRFQGVAGQTSPGMTGSMTGSEQGTIHGGYRAVITGSMLASPLLNTHGSIGTTDYQCDINGNCPGAFDWTAKYFNTSASNFTFNFGWWGWTYKNAQHVWINSSDGNSGDVI